MSADPSVSVRFMLDADAAPGLLCRLLQPFAKRDLMPDRMWSYRAGEIVHVEIAMTDLPGAVVHLLEGNLRQVVGVRSVIQLRPEAARHAA